MLPGMVGFLTEDELVDDFMAKFENQSKHGTLLSSCDVLGGIVFNINTNDTSLPERIEYKIRLPYTPRRANTAFHLDPNMGDTSWRTEFMFPLYQTVGPRANGTRFSDDPGMSAN